MKNLSLEQFYKAIDKHIKLLCAYLDDSSYEFVIKSCRLKPYNSVFGNFKSSDIKLCDRWIDEYGNELIIENKKAHIKYNSINKNKLIYTDIYTYCNFEFVKNQSKFFLIISNNEFNKTNNIICFLGFDNFLRLFFNDNFNNSPLELGLVILKELSNYLKINDFVKLDLKISEIIFGMSNLRCWFSILPPSNNFLIDLNKNNVNIRGIL